MIFPQVGPGSGELFYAFPLLCVTYTVIHVPYTHLGTYLSTVLHSIRV